VSLFSFNLNLLITIDGHIPPNDLVMYRFCFWKANGFTSKTFDVGT